MIFVQIRNIKFTYYVCLCRARVCVCVCYVVLLLTGCTISVLIRCGVRTLECACANECRVTSPPPPLYAYLPYTECITLTSR